MKTSNELPNPARRIRCQRQLRTRRRSPVFGMINRCKLAGDQSVLADWQLAGNEQQVSSPHERHILGQRRLRFGQLDAHFRQPRLDPSSHDSILPQ